MEREITVWESAKQKKTVFTSHAETLGQLKEELAQQNIDVTNMSILEGVSHTQLLSNESILPHDIPYRGEVTNNLLIYLTLQDKKVASGVIDRYAIGDWIKKNNLQYDLIKAFGDNWTRVSTENLVKFYEEHQATQSMGETGKPKEENSKTLENLLNWASKLTEILFDIDALNYKETSELNKLLAYAAEESESEDTKGGFSRSEIDDMINEF